MNKTLSIGLAGYSFMIEEHAHIKLSDYLSALRKTLEPTEVDEVMHDIEIRMVEIFKDSLGKREVINDTDVEKVIAQIGKPEQIEEREEHHFLDEQDKHSNNRFSSAFPKQLFRDPENKKLGGVCSGLAHYFGTNVTLMRLIWLTIGLIGLVTHISTGLEVLIYIVLWIVLPKAKTASDFLKMKGKPMNFDNLKQESNKIVQFTTDSSQKVGEFYRDNQASISSAGNSLQTIIRFILGGILGLVGLSLLFSSIAIFGGSFDNDLISLPANLEFYLEDNWLKYFGIALAFLTVFIPALIFLFLSIKAISPKTKLNYTGYVFAALAFLWIICLALVGVKAFKIKSQYSGHNTENSNIAINTTSDTLQVDLKKVLVPQNFQSVGNDTFTDKKIVFEQQLPDINVTRKEGNFTAYLIVKKEARGYNQPLKVEVPVEIHNNKILIPNYINYPFEYRTRQYHISYELVVPKNKKVIALNNENAFSLNDEDEDKQNQKPTDSTATSIKVSPNNNIVIVNGKKVTEQEADRMLQEADKKTYKNVSISIINGKKEITIKTN